MPADQGTSVHGTQLPCLEAQKTTNILLKIKLPRCSYLSMASFCLVFILFIYLWKSQATYPAIWSKKKHFLDFLQSVRIQSSRIPIFLCNKHDPGYKRWEGFTQENKSGKKSQLSLCASSADRFIYPRNMQPRIPRYRCSLVCSHHTNTRKRPNLSQYFSNLPISSLSPYSSCSSYTEVAILLNHSLLMLDLLLVLLGIPFLFSLPSFIQLVLHPSNFTSEMLPLSSLTPAPR